MKATKTLHDLGQSLWLDNITRDLVRNGTLARYIDDLSVTGLTSNPTIFDHAIKNSTAYDAAIQQKVKERKSGETLFFELALEDLTAAADLRVHRQAECFVPSRFGAGDDVHHPGLVAIHVQLVDPAGTRAFARDCLEVGLARRAEDLDRPEGLRRAAANETQIAGLLGVATKEHAPAHVGHAHQIVMPGMHVKRVTR